MPSDQPIGPPASQGTPTVTGWPSPAESFTESLDLHRALIHHPSATYLLRVGDAALAPRLQPNDIAIIDRSLFPRHGDVVLVQLGSAFVFRRFERRGASVYLVADNSDAETLELSKPQETEAVLWGVVTYAILQPRVW